MDKELILVPQPVIPPAPPPDLMAPPEPPVCLKPKKKGVVSVPEIESAHKCEGEARVQTDAQLRALQDAIRNREAEMVKLKAEAEQKLRDARDGRDN